MDTYVYEIGENLYINLTNKCSNACTFCVINKGEFYDGHNLRLGREPDAADILPLIGDPLRYKEIVFCGYGEPTYRYDVITEVAAVLKKAGAVLRLNTNGQAELILGKDVSAEIAVLFDTVSISLNAATAEGYQQLCRSVFGEKAFAYILDFAQKCTVRGAKVVMTAVDVLPESEITAAKKLAESVGAEFKLRPLID